MLRDRRMDSWTDRNDEPTSLFSILRKRLKKNVLNTSHFPPSYGAMIKGWVLPVRLRILFYNCPFSDVTGATIIPLN